MELSKLKHLQFYITTFEIYYRKFELLPQRHQPYTIFQSKIEEVFENLETADADMSTSHYIIEPIFNRYLVTHFTTRMDQINVNASIKKLVGSINTETIK